MNPIRLFIFTIWCWLPNTLYAQQPSNTTSVKLFFEKAYLHTDREVYAGGEDIWFKAYLVNAQTSQLIGSSNNLYVELISPDSKLSDRKTIRLEKGLGNGDFRLGDSIAPGIYRIRAYTSWMRNFGEYFIFEKQVRVFSQPRAVTGSQESKVKTQKTAITAQPSDVTTVTASNSAVIRFFPEGGSMTEGVTGLVAFRAEDASGKGISASGDILSASGEMFASFSAGDSGMGMVMLSPQTGTTYIAKGTFGNGEPFSSKLPTALATGFSINVRNADSLLYLTVSTNTATLAAQQGGSMTILCKSRGKALYSASFTLKELQTAIAIPKVRFPDGIVSIALYDAAGRPNCERLIYADRAETTFLSITPDKSSYVSQGKTTLMLKVFDEERLPVRASLSVAAVDAGVTPESPSSIVAYLNLQSELRGVIENPTRYFDSGNPLRGRQLDLLLLTQGWRDYTWKRLADSALKISYAMEQGITISGRVTDISKKNKPVMGANISLSAPGAKGVRLFSSSTDSLGMYYFDNVPLYGEQSLRIRSLNGKGESYGSITLDSLFKNPLPISAKHGSGIASLPVSASPTALAERIAMAKKISLSDTISMKEIKIYGSKFIQLSDQLAQGFGYKDEVLNVDPKDYDHRNLLHYLQHYSKALVNDITFVQPPLKPWRILKPSENLPQTDSYMTYNLLYYPGPLGKPLFPRLVVNGMEIPYSDEPEDYPRMADYQQIYFTLPVDKVQKVVVRHLLGQHAQDIYIVYLTLKPGTMEPARYDAVAANVTGYYEARTFYAPRYETPGSKADYRNTIHWEPNISTNEKGEATVTFYNADPKTKVRIVAEGITDKGIPVRATAGYEVK